MVESFCFFVILEELTGHTVFLGKQCMSPQQLKTVFKTGLFSLTVLLPKQQFRVIHTKLLRFVLL